MPSIRIDLTDEQKKYLSEELKVKNLSVYLRELIRSANPRFPDDAKWGGKRKKSDKDGE